VNELRAPFPYPGGKSRVADICWRAFGRDVPGYSEIFAGSSAVLLGRPGGAGKYETINDTNGFIANAWRSIKLRPSETARHANNPPCELDLRARAKLLLEWSPLLVAQLAENPEWCDPKAAGWWIWCQSVAICSHGGLGQGSINKGVRHGVTGVSAPPVESWLAGLSLRLRTVNICCGDWSRLVTPTALGFNNTGTTPCAIFADPPYPDEELDYSAVDSDCARKCAAWCSENGEDPRLRIVLAGHVGDYDMPSTWRVLNWGGSRGHGRAKRGDNECLWLSPHCLPIEQQRSLFGTG
jgi:DNA adenine methylase